MAGRFTGRGPRRAALLSTAALVAAIAAGCGGDDSDAGAETDPLPSVPEVTVEGVSGSERSAFLQLASSVQGLRAQTIILRQAAGASNRVLQRQLNAMAVRIRVIETGDRRLARARDRLFRATRDAAKLAARGEREQAVLALRGATRKSSTELGRYAKGKPGLRKMLGSDRS